MSLQSPVIKLELDRMRHSIMACLGPALESERDEINDLVRVAIESFDLNFEVRRVVYSCLSEEIASAVKSAVHTAFLSNEVQAIFANEAKRIVKQTLEYMEQK